MKFKVWCKNKNEWEKDKCFLSTEGLLYQQSRLNIIVPLSLETHVVCWYIGFKDIYNEEMYTNYLIGGYDPNDEPIKEFKIKWDKEHSGYNFEYQYGDQDLISIGDAIREGFELIIGGIDLTEEPNKNIKCPG